MTLENIQKEAIEKFGEEFAYLKPPQEHYFSQVDMKDWYWLEEFISDQVTTAYQKGKEEGLLSKEE